MLCIVHICIHSRFIIIIIFITYTPVTNKHTHEKHKKDLKHTLSNNNYLQQTEFTSY